MGNDRDEEVLEITYNEWLTELILHGRYYEEEHTTGSRLVALPVSGGVYDGLDHALWVEAWWRFAGREVLEGGHVLLDDRRGRHHRPQLLTGVHRIGRSVHVLLEGIGAQVHRSGHGRLNELAPRWAPPSVGTKPIVRSSRSTSP